MNKEKHWIMTIDHINTKQLTEKERNKQNDWEIEVTTMKPRKRKPKTKKIKLDSWVVKTYNYREDWKLFVWRKTVVDDEVVRKLQEAFRCDCTVEEACAYAWISRDTYYRKLNEDKTFSDRMDDSSKQFMVDVKIRAKELMIWAETESVSWTLLKNALEKRDPNYKTKIETENNTTINVSFVWIAMRAKEQRMEAQDIDKQEKKLSEQNWESIILPIRENEN